MTVDLTVDQHWNGTTLGTEDDPIVVYDNDALEHTDPVVDSSCADSAADLQENAMGVSQDVLCSEAPDPRIDRHMH